MIRKARASDVKKIYSLVNNYAKKDLMLARSLSELYENLRDFFVYEYKGRVIGCCALHINWEDLAEVKSLAVEPRYKRKGIGTWLLEVAIEEARELGMKRLFVLTYVPEFFKRQGFRRIDKSKLPHKIWSECIHCPKFPGCDEAALVRILR